MAAHNEAPCRVSADLRLQQIEDEQAVRMYDAAGAVAAAKEQIHDPDSLKKLLNDEELAPHLAECFASLESAMQEMAVVAPSAAFPSVALILNRVARMERIAFNWAMGE